MKGGSASFRDGSAEVRCAIEEGDPIPDDVLGEWCAGRNVTVWAITEGSDLTGGPLMCCAGLDALAFTDAMSAANVFAQVDLLPCCQGLGGGFATDDDGDPIGCIRDTFDDVPANVLAVLHAASARHGIDWPDDIAGPAHDWTSAP